MKERKPLPREAARRHQEAGTKKGKSAIPDELVRYTKMNRKYLVHVLASAGRANAVRAGMKSAAGKRRKGGGRKPICSGEFAVALRAIWAFFWCQRGKILAPFMREQMLKGKSGTKPGNLLKKQIPVRHADAGKKPGFFENDTAHHCGTSDFGEFLLTLTSTDAYSGWTELRAVPNKARKWTFEALADVRASLPFPLLGKTRVGAKVKKACDKNILTPCQRLTLSADLSDEAKAELARRMGLHDPVRLQREVRDAVAALMELNGKGNLEGAEALAALHAD